MASEVAPPTMSPSSERYNPGDGIKRTSTTQETEMHRKDRSFQDCIELLMPVYLLPFVFGDKAGTCIYCVLLTVVGLMGRVLPSAVAAMLPVVVLPLGDVCGVDQLAAAYLGPRVLSVSLLFAVAIIGDETTIFFRLCLYALERYALRMQPLFVCMHLLVFALSLILPSTLIVVFSTVFIERFVTTIQDEIEGPDQRGGVRIRAGSNCADAARRPRCGRTAGMGASARRVRSVSVVSEASEASGSSSVVRQFKMHPDLRRLETQDAPRVKKEPRKTSFGVSERPQRGVDGRPLFLPVRRIRSLSMEPKRPSSILKRNSSATPPPPTPQSLPPTPPCPLPSPSAVATGAEERKSSFPTAGFQLTPPLGSSGGEESHEVRDQAPMSRKRSTQSSSAVASPSAPSAFTPLQDTSVVSPKASHSIVRGSSLAALTSPGADRPSAATAGVSSPSARRKGGKYRSPSPRRSKASSKPSRDHEADATARTREGNAQALSPVQKDSAINSPVPGQTVHHSRSLQAIGTKREVREAPYTSKSKEKTVPDPDPEAKLDRAPKFKEKTVPDPDPEAKPDTAPARKPALLSEPRTRLESVAVEKEQEPRPEVRGVLKKRYPSIQPSIGSHSSSMLSWKRLTPFGNDIGNPDSRTTPRGVIGAEQQTSSLRMRALTMVARPAFIAGATYTAIFGNIASFSTLPTRDTVLVTLGCSDDVCPVNWQSWLAVSFPVALVCCVICWTSIYSASLVRWDEDTEERVHNDVSKCARLRHRNMKRHTTREALVFYWLMGIPVASSAYGIQHPEWHLEVPFLGLTVLVLSVAPGSLWRHWWSNRALSWRSLCSRMPWNIILMLGSVMALNRTVEEYRLVEFGLNKLDDQFWAQRSTRSSQFILVSVAAVLSELVVGESLAQSMATTVVRVAVVTETPVSFYVVPVSMVASINVMLPVSLPLLVMREYLHTKSAQMVAYGVFIKCIAVAAIFVSMNTIGLVAFQGDPLPKAPAMRTLHNSTDINSL